MARTTLPRRWAAAPVLTPLVLQLGVAAPGAPAGGGGASAAAPAGANPASLWTAAPIDQQLGGTVQAVALKGTTAFVGVGPRVAVLDTIDLGAPDVAGRWRPETTGVAAVSVEGELVAVGASEGLVLVEAKPDDP